MELAPDTDQPASGGVPAHEVVLRLSAPAVVTVVEASAFVTDVIGRIDQFLAAGEPASAGALPRVVELDMSALERFDSAAVAALIALERRAIARNLYLHCVNVGANLRKLAALYEVDSLLCAD